MSGRLVNALLLYHQELHRDEGGKSLLTPTAIAKWTKSHPKVVQLDKPDLSKFLHGEPSGPTKAEKENPRWFSATWDLLELITFGSEVQPKNPNDEKRILFDKMRRFFLGSRNGSYQRGKYPLYFAPERRTSRGPYNEEEAFQGLEWLGIRHEIYRGTGTIAFVSANEKFLQKYEEPGHPNPAAMYTIKWAAQGFDTYFLFPHESLGESDAANSVEAFLASLAKDPSARPAVPNTWRLPLNKDSGKQNATSWPGQFLHRTCQYTYVEYQYNGQDGPETHQDLYVSLTSLEPPDIKNYPLAFLANQQRTQEFSRWLRSMIPPEQEELLRHQGWRNTATR